MEQRDRREPGAHIDSTDRAASQGGSARPDQAGRRAADEAAANDARRRYRGGRVPPLASQPVVEGFLLHGEQVIATRRSCALDRLGAPGSADALGVPGELYVTTLRLIHRGAQCLAVCLGEIEEAALANGAVLLRLRDGTGLALACAQPMLLRVQIAAARAAIRSASRDSAPTPGSSGAGSDTTA